MEKGISILTSSVEIGLEMKFHMSQSEINELIKHELSGALANKIIEDMENLPITHHVYEVPDNFTNVHRFEMRLISREELRRLKEIERDYNNIMQSALKYNK